VTSIPGQKLLSSLSAWESVGILRIGIAKYIGIGVLVGGRKPRASLPESCLGAPANPDKYGGSGLWFVCRRGESELEISLAQQIFLVGGFCGVDYRSVR
jgi:hypothetical protein